MRTSEPACPFCGGALGDEVQRAVVPGSTQRLTRAAAWVFGATLALTGCSDGGNPGGDSSAQQDGGVSDDGGNQALYDLPADDGGPDDDGGAQAEYGAPADDGGSNGARYGAPPPPDADG